MVHFVKDYQTALYYCLTRRFDDEVVYQLETFINGKSAIISYEIEPCGDRDENSAAVIKKATLSDGTEIIVNPEWGYEDDCLDHFINIQHTTYLKSGQIL